MIEMLVQAQGAAAPPGAAIAARHPAAAAARRPIDATQCHNVATAVDRESQMRIFFHRFSPHEPNRRAAIT